MNHFFERRPGLCLASRCLAAIAGGYALSSAWIVLWGAVEQDSAEALFAGMQTSFVLYVLAVIWAFSPVPLRRVWGGLIAATGLLLCSAALFARWGA